MSFGLNGPYIQEFPSGSKVMTYNLSKANIHTYVAPEESFGNATHIIETLNYLTIVDTQYAIPYSKEFRRYANSLNKPIAGVIISHAHPDHYFGLTSAFSDVPSYALRETIKDIKEKGPTMIKEGKKEMGDLVPDHVTVPFNVLNLGEVNVDGIIFSYRKYDRAEADTQVIIELPELEVVIVQDAVYNGYHPWLGQYTDNWIRLLNTLKRDYRDMIVLAGHGDPTSPSDYDAMKQYLVNAKSIIARADGNKQLIERELVKTYPNYKGRKIIPMWLSYA